MHRTESDNKITVGGKNQFTNGPPGTTRDAVDINTTQEELAFVIEQAGLTLKTVGTETNEQLKEAIDAIILANSPNAPVVDFESKNLIINVQSNTTVDADADRLSFINSSNVPIFQNDIDVTFDITANLMAGTSEKASTWYQMWLDSAGVKLLVPDLLGTADSDVAGELIDSTATFETDQVQPGDIVYNLTDLTQGTVVSVDSETEITLSSDFFPDGDEDYKIRMLSPVGLGASKARIGAAFNNAANNFDDSTYAQIQEEKFYSEAAGDFTVTGTSLSNIFVEVSIKQVNDWTGLGIWELFYSLNVTQGSAVSNTISISGIVSAAFTQGVGFVSAAGTSATVLRGFFNSGSGDILFLYDGVQTLVIIEGHVFLGKKPTFHN